MGPRNTFTVLIAVFTAISIISADPLMSEASAVRTRTAPRDARDLTNRREYYEIVDLAEAASQIRSAAADLGVEVSEIPPVLPNSEAVYGVSWTHFGVDREFDLSDRSFVFKLEGLSEESQVDSEFVAFLLVNRSLSVDEVCGILESGVRIYKLVHGGYVVGGKAESLLLAAQQTYCRWLGEVLPEYKVPVVFNDKEPRFQVFGYYKSIRPLYRRDLEDIGVVITFEADSYVFFEVEAPNGKIWEVAKLPWVQHIAGPEALVDH